MIAAPDHEAGARIESIEPESLAEELGLAAGDRILAVDGHPIKDVIEYKYRLAGEKVELLVLKANGEEWEIDLEKDYDQDLGVGFASPVFDRVRRCANRCIFCFVDQMPKGLRRSLYVKDDDYRLSFWDGNFITLTNLTEDDLRRVEEERLSPLHISVHTTDPELRRRMMGNPKAGEALPLLRRLAASRIEMHLQIVLCPGINDGLELWRTVRDLESLRPYVLSIAAVPVGLTGFRDGLAALRRYDREESAAVVRDIEAHQKGFMEKHGSRLLFASDEFYLVGGRPVPPAEAYEGFPQLENGVGLVRRFWDGFAKERWTADDVRVGSLTPSAVGTARKSGRRTWIVTGVLGAAALAPLIERFEGPVELVSVTNEFFGPTVTATGLLTAGDIVKTLDARVAAAGGVGGALADGDSVNLRVLVPDIIFRSGQGVTLDERDQEGLVREIARVTGLPAKAVAVVGTEPEALARVLA